MTGEKQNKSRAFRRFLLIFTLLWVALWIFLVGYVYRCLKIYEAAQPERRVEEVVDELRAGTLRQVLEAEPECSRFEDKAALRNDYRTRVERSELTWRKAAGSYDAKAPVYDIYAGETRVATVSLRESSSRSLMLILTLQEWEIAEVRPVFEPGDLAYSISIPNNYTLYVNGLPADGRERTGKRTELEKFRYATAYVTVPVLVEYRIDGLRQEPDIRVCSPDGTEVEPVLTREGTWLVDSFAASEMAPELAEQVLKNAKDYSNFFSRDLPGALAGVACLEGMFPKDSYYLELAEEYRRHDMWMYSSHYEPTFSDEKVENYIRYSDNFFSCEVSFDKRMILTATGQERHDLTHTRFYYVALNGRWVIADMQQILSGAE